ncbi:uncharacterized protein DUF3263 [Branchiibius hedensis]|uniref:DUF3263 domain-containing protein n=2 Tax=Branchiibius hedensis TaxID=672460 RepID=A0A2Y9BLZ3_9MICO|nr:uncharacterized protein DUF3263 [Branchiibius hedensis]PWJ23935.1 uncharacterized protein DUF3263 [Branchiibius hedensis]SSA32753.1 Protein of unknown function [Branchiibius hedensis]SSA59167.1 Protein of unknown function [Branchiibius hedensis]
MSETRSNAESRPSMADLLAFERAWLGRRRDGAYDAAVRQEFGVTTVRHLQRVNALLDDPEAMALDPVTCRVLRSRRAAGMRQRG